MVALEAVPLSALGWDFRIERAGRPITTLALTRFRDRGTFTWEGSECHISASGFVRRTYRLERGGLTTASAATRGWLRPTFLVAAGDRELVLRRTGFLGHAMTVDHNRTHLGDIRKASLLKRAVTASLDERIAGAVPVFLLFLAIVEWRRDSRRRS